MCPVLNVSTARFWSFADSTLHLTAPTKGLQEHGSRKETVGILTGSQVGRVDLWGKGVKPYLV